MKNNLKNKKGFTLVETLVGIGIFVLIIAAIALLGKNIWVYNSFISEELDSENTNQKALKNMIAEIRTASSGNDGAYAISQASTTSFTFYSDIYDNGLKEKVRYFLNGSSLQKGVIIPTGTPLGYTGTEIITTIIPNVTSSSVFYFYDKNYDGTTPPLSPIDISKIRLVKITVTTDKNPNTSPPPITTSSQVMLRNLKDNL